MKCDDMMNRPEIRPKVDDLPHSQANQHSHCSNGKPFHSLISALVCVTKMLLSLAKVVHLHNNLADHLFDPAKVRLDRFQFFPGLDRTPVLGIRSYVDVEFNVPHRVHYSVFCTRCISDRHQSTLRRVCDLRALSMFSKHTSKAESACEVNAYLVSPTTSLGRA